VLWSWIVRAHPDEPRVGHPQDHVAKDITGKTQDPGKKPNLGHQQRTYPRKLGVGFEEFAKDGGGVFAEFAIAGAKGSEEVGVNVEFTNDFAVDEDGDNDLGFGFERAGEIAGIAGDIVNDKGHAAAGSGTANALVERDACVGRHGALEGAENEDIAFRFVRKHVKADPIVFGELMVEQRDDVLHQSFGRTSGNGQSIQFENEVRRFRMSRSHDSLVKHKRDES